MLHTAARLPAESLHRVGRALDRRAAGGARVQDLFERHYVWVAGAVATVVGGIEVAYYGVIPANWDWMAISGVATLLIGLALARSFRPAFENAVMRLRNAGTMYEEQPSTLDSWFRERLGDWAHRTGLALAVVITLAYIAAYGLTPLRDRTEILASTVVAIAAAYVVGRYVGQALLFGNLYRACKESGVRLVLQPGHLDGAAGWRPLGHLYLRQALMLALPAAHLGLWWFLIPAMDQYEEWRNPYAWLLGVVVLCEIASFVAPMWSFHLEMSRQKTVLLKEADGLGRRVADVKAKLSNTTESTVRAQLREQLDVLTDRHSTLEHLPTWPVDSATRRRFTINNAILAVPLVASWLDQVVGSWSNLGSKFD